MKEKRKRSVKKWTLTNFGQSGDDDEEGESDVDANLIPAPSGHVDAVAVMCGLSDRIVLIPVVGCGRWLAVIDTFPAATVFNGTSSVT